MIATNAFSKILQMCKKNISGEPEFCGSIKNQPLTPAESSTFKKRKCRSLLFNLKALSQRAL